MEKTLVGSKNKLMLLATIGFIFGGSSAFAQTSSEIVTVQAPHVHARLVRPAIGRQSMPLKRISYRVAVSYSDLDLSQKSDVAKFRGRIRIAALEACHRLDMKFMPSVYISDTPEQDCFGDAVKTGLARANMIIDQAAKKTERL